MATKHAKKVPVKERFKDKFYMNWQKACQVLLIAKKYLDRYVTKKLPELHEDLRISITDIYSCYECTTKDIKWEDGKWDLKCPHVVCQSWVQQLSLRHLHPENIYWRNSDMRMWPSSQWEVAKVFMGKLPSVFNSDRNRSINEEDSSENTELSMIPEVPPDNIDISHVLNVLINCKWFHADNQIKKRKFGIDSEVLQSIKDVQQTRNELFHNAVLKVQQENIENCKRKMDIMLKKLRIYNEFYKKEIEELLALDPMYMERIDYEKFLRLEASVTAALIDEYGAAEEDEQENNENLDRLLQILEAPENADLRASVSMIRNIPRDIGEGTGEGDGDVLEPSQVDVDLPLMLDPQPVNSYNIHMKFPSTGDNLQNTEKLVLERVESVITDVELPSGQNTDIYDLNNLAPNKKYKYRMKVIDPVTFEVVRHGPWSEASTPEDIRTEPRYIQWQALCRMLLDFAIQITSKFNFPGMSQDNTALLDKLFTTKTELYETHMLSVSNEYWLQISKEYFTGNSKLQNKYNYILYHGSPKTSVETQKDAKMTVQSGTINDISETLFLADFLCHMYRYIEAGNNPTQKHEELNSVFCMFKNDMQLKDAVNSQLKCQIKDPGVINLVNLSIDEMEMRWKQCQNSGH